MIHEHIVKDSDKHFLIDPVTREIVNESGKIVLVQGDHKSEQFTFTIPRYVDGHDMSLCNMVQVHYTNTETGTGAVNEDVHETADLRVSPESEDAVIFSWLITGNATQYVGSLAFSISYNCVADDGTIEYSWNTVDYTEISIKSRSNNSESVVTTYPDVLAKWRSDTFQMVQDQIDMVVEGEAYVNRSGDTMTGNLGVPAPVEAGHAVNKAYADTKQAQHINKVITLPASGWSDNRQTVSWAGLEEDDTLISTPSADSRELYTECGVKLYYQTQGALTYACEDVPGEALTINVSCFAVGGSGVAGGGSSGSGPSGGSGSVSYEIPEFDLAAMGLPAIPMEGDYVNVLVDTTDLFEALNNGLVKVRFAVDDGDGSVEYFSDVATGMYLYGQWIISRTLIDNKSFGYTIYVDNHGIFAMIKSLQNALPDGGGDSYEIPEFDLVSMGLPTIPADGSYVSVDVDTTSLIEAFEKGTIKINLSVDLGDDGVYHFNELATGIYLNDQWVISRTLSVYGKCYCYTILGSPGVIYGQVLKLQTELTGGGAQCDWNNMLNKPFGESSTGGDTLTWDGNIDGLLSVADELYKISDAVLTMDDFANGGVVQVFNGGELFTELPINSETVGEYAEGILSVRGVALIISEAAVGVEIEGYAFSEAGVYCPFLDGMTLKMTVNGYTGFTVVKKIEEKYLPDTVATKDYVEQVILGGAW